MNDKTPIDPDFASLPDDVRADIEGAQGVGLHQVPEIDRSAEAIDGEAEFRHPETDVAGTAWEPNWEPLDTYKGGVVMLDNGDRQILATRRDGTWFELIDGDEIPLGGFDAMLWSDVPPQVRDDMI